MNKTAVSLHHERTPYDGWRSIVISLYMALVGYGVLVGVPVISTAWVTLLGFSEVEVGRVAGADLGGLSAGAILTAVFIARVDRRLLVLLGLAIAVAANALCLKFVDYEQVLWLRLGAGFGSGIYTAVAVACLGASSKPARAYNAMLFAFAFSQALELHILPQLSMNGIYLVFIGCFLFTLLISVFSFNLLWIFIDVYQMSTVANVDHSGRFAALMPGAQGLSQIVGPNLAASILGFNFGYSGVFIMCAGAALTGMAVYAFMYLRLKRTIPALAYAS